MKIKGNYVLIKVLEAEERSKGGIIMPDQTKKNTPGIIGEVVAIGEGSYLESYEFNPETQEINKVWKLMPIDEEIRPGRKVVYPKWAGHEVQIDQEKYLLVREHDILAAIDE